MGSYNIKYGHLGILLIEKIIRRVTIDCDWQSLSKLCFLQILSFSIRNGIILFLFYEDDSPAYPNTASTLPLSPHLIMDYIKSFTKDFYSFLEALQLELNTQFYLKFSMIQVNMSSIIFFILFLIVFLIIPAYFGHCSTLGQCLQNIIYSDISLNKSFGIK